MTLKASTKQKQGTEQIAIDDENMIARDVVQNTHAEGARLLIKNELIARKKNILQECRSNKGENSRKSKKATEKVVSTVIRNTILT